MERRDQMEGVERVRDILQSIDMKRKRKPLTIIFVKGERCEKRKSACLDIIDCINRRVSAYFWIIFR